MNELCVVIPMKSVSRSKQRLADCLSDNDRESLSIELFLNTLIFFHYYFPTTQVLVVSESEHILKLSRSYGAYGLFNDGEKGLNGALSHATNWVMNAGFNRQLIIPGDIALLDLSEINKIIEESRKVDVVIALAKDGGTNALLTSPPNAIDFSYGHESSSLHVQDAMRKGKSFNRLQLKNMSLDIDHKEDLYKAADQQPDRFKHWASIPAKEFAEQEYKKGSLYA